jgi:hypothetical protein
VKFLTLKRVVIYPKDIMQITGKSERYSREILRKIKTLHNKQKHQLVSLQEFCDFIGLNTSEVEHKLRS